MPNALIKNPNAFPGPGIVLAQSAASAIFPTSETEKGERKAEVPVYICWFLEFKMPHNAAVAVDENQGKKSKLP
jgi:hypothetical protein